MVSEKSEETSNEALKANITRELMYVFLSRAFKVEVDERFLETMATIEPTIKLLSESYGDKELDEGNRLLHEFIEHVKRLKGQDRKALLTDLAVEYASLFLGVGINPVHLVESVYLGKDHLLFEESYHQVLEAYRSLGFEKEKGFTEPDDHVAVEFEFMANLCRWTTKTLEKGDLGNAVAYLNLQKEFLTDHIMKWVPDLCHKLKSGATSDLYKAMAYLTNGFIELDNEMPDHLTTILKNPVSAKE